MQAKNLSFLLVGKRIYRWVSIKTWLLAVISMYFIFSCIRCRVLWPSSCKRPYYSFASARDLLLMIWLDTHQPSPLSFLPWFPVGSDASLYPRHLKCHLIGLFLEIVSLNCLAASRWFGRLVHKVGGSAFHAMPLGSERITETFSSMESSQRAIWQRLECLQAGRQAGAPSLPS